LSRLHELSDSCFFYKSRAQNVRLLHLNTLSADVGPLTNSSVNNVTCDVM